MKFAQRGAEHGVLDLREDLVADELVERHPARQRRSVRHHSRAEYGVRLTRFERPKELGKGLGRVLAVPMQVRVDVVTLLDRVAVAADLIAAVAEVLLVAKDAELGLSVQGLVAHPDEERVVAARIVEDENLFDLVPDLL